MYEHCGKLSKRNEQTNGSKNTEDGLHGVIQTQEQACHRLHVIAIPIEEGQGERTDIGRLRKQTVNVS